MSWLLIYNFYNFLLNEIKAIVDENVTLECVKTESVAIKKNRGSIN